MDLETKQLLANVWNMLIELEVKGMKNVTLLAGVFADMQQIMQKVMQEQNTKEGE